jgi:hypothetical protein
MTRALRHFVLSFALVPMLAAQEQKPATDPAPVAKPTAVAKPAPVAGQGNIAEKTDRMRSQLQAGRPVRSHVRVLVRLKNGNRLRGIVKDGRVVERIDGLRFVQADADEQGAGVRLWYWDNTNNYVFLPFKDILDYRIQEQLSTEQLLAIEKDVTEAERKKAEVSTEKKPGDAPPTPEPIAADGTLEPKPIADKKPDDAKDPKDATKDPAKDATKDADKLKQQVGLLQEFPPASGWSAAKRDEIKRRLAVIGVKPSPQEERFVSVFDQWMAACQTVGIAPPTPAPGTQSDSGSTDTGKKKRR